MLQKVNIDLQEKRLV